MAKNLEVTKKVEAINDLRQDDPELAYKLVFRHVRSIDTRDFTDESVADAFCEYVYAGLIALKSALERQVLLEDALEIADRALIILKANSPLGESPKEAAKRGDFWDNSFEGQHIQLIVFQELLYYVNLLQYILPNTDLHELCASALGAFQEVSSEHPEERFNEIYSIKNESSPDLVLNAYHKYQEKIAMIKDGVPGDEQAYILNLVLANQLGAGKLGSFNTLRQQSGLSLSQALVRGGKQVVKNVQKKTLRLGWKAQSYMYQLIHRDEIEDPYTDPYSELFSTQWYGFGKGQAKRITKQE